ncbi:DUF4149 domain-containing protein [Polynucleobacter antarcticus]|uniref:DUF4149 domain-containing protein n=2 Tax=Polynucleobacter antarcticus TaxID=1743162 RepID=A0A6M9PY57_9BURK|nr:DUF4149 domain-containing protein [Polynucleobacter antarcticus]
MLGIMLFFTVAVAPTVFKVLPQEWSSKYVRAFFPKYYIFLGLFTCLAAFLVEGYVNTILLVFCAALFLLSLVVLTPAINRAADSGNKKYFGLLHGSSVIINLLQFVIFIYVLLYE